MKKSLLALTALALTIPYQAQGETLSERLAGRILLQVESRGEAWYINPDTKTRFSLGKPEDAWNIMREQALGISNQNLAKIPTAVQTFTGDQELSKRVSGKILLAVESKGEAWYVDPVSLKRIYLGRPTDALEVMRTYGLGITNANLTQISIATDENAKITNVVPFIAQAPLGDWSDPRQQDGCEESSAIMAVAWARGEDLSKERALELITSMSDWQNEQFGYFMDSSIDDTANNLLGSYLNFTNFTVQKNITTEDIKNELAKGNIVIVAVNGIKLQNPNFIGGGPLRHMALIVGYDPGTQTFLTHDPGTQNGANYPYTEAIIADSLMDYPSGNHTPVTPMPNGMIIIEKE
ncbi:C39 family peptidase [Patescibacteria group bacterium]|nr:C39 family peptidase [Patescibacteria group bacterium]